MNDLRNDKLEDYYEAAESWADDRQEASDRSRKVAWIVAGIALVVALVEAIALVLLIPLKREVPYTLLVDRQTGYVEALRPLDQQSLTADEALTRSFLVQYVIARESFNIDLVQENFRKVGLWSVGDAWSRYEALIRSSNPASPVATLPRAATVDVRIRSVSTLSPGNAMVRFETVRMDRGSTRQTIENWVSVIAWRFNDAEMSAEDRYDNPFGFQVTDYNRSAETLPIVEEQAREAPSSPGVERPQ